MRSICAFFVASFVYSSLSKFTPSLGVRADLRFPVTARATNKDGSLPLYKNPRASIEARVADLLPRMTLEEKVAQIIQGDINGWMNMNDPLDDTKAFNQTGLEEMMRTKAGAIWGGYLAPWDKIAFAITIGQRYLVENTTLGIPALFQTEGLHGFTNNGTIWPSPIGMAASFDTDLLRKAASTIADEAEGLGYSHVFAPVLDLSRELRWGRVEENFGEDPFLTGEMGLAYVTGLQSGRRRNASSTAIARMAATCKHFAAFGSPQGGLNIAQVSGGERELRTVFLKPFERACIQSLSIMTAYSSYDGIPAVADKRASIGLSLCCSGVSLNATTDLLTDILRTEWGYKYWVTSDAGSVDLLITTHGTCNTRECAAKTALENGLSGEMGGGTYTYLTLPEQIRAGTVDVQLLDETVMAMLRTKLSLGLFENPYPYNDYVETLRTPETRTLMHQMDRESIVLLENKNGVLPLSKSIKSIALIGPQVNRVSFGDYVFFNATLNGVSPLDGFERLLSNTSIKINYAEGCKLWSNDNSGIPQAISAAQASEVAVVMVGTWSLDQTLLWTPGTNATTGEHVDLSDLGLVGSQLELVQAVKASGKPTIVVFVSGKPIAEPWISENADAVIQQFYPGELGGLALAEVIFGDVNPSGGTIRYEEATAVIHRYHTGKLPVSFPRSVGTTPVFYNYIKGSRPLDPGQVFDDGTLRFGHQYVLDSPLPLWSFGHGLSYTTFSYSDLTLSKNPIKTSDSFNVFVTVRNTGAVSGKEVVQVYATDVTSSVATPNQELVGFKKVSLDPGQSKIVSIQVNSTQLAVWTVKGTWSVEPGQFFIKIGTSDQTFLNTTLNVV